MDVRLLVFLFRPQVQERGAADLVSLLDAYVYGVYPEVTVFDEVASETAVGAACGRVLGEAEAGGEHSCREVGVLMRFGAEDQNVFGLDVAYQLEVAVVQIGTFEAEGAGDLGGVQRRRERGRELAHPETLAEAHGDLTGLQVQGDAPCGAGEDLVPDHVRGT